MADKKEHKKDPRSKEVKNNCHAELTSHCKASYFDTTKVCPFKFSPNEESLFFHLDHIISVPLRKSIKFDKLGNSLVAQWLRIRLPMQGTRV